MPTKRKGMPIKNKRHSITSEYSLDGLFDEFYRVKVAEGRADTTLEAYKENYRFFTEFLDERGIRRDVRLITTDTIRDYITYMLKEKVRFDGHRFKSEREQTVGLSPVTINTRLKALRVFFRYLCEEDGIIAENPMDDVKNVEEPEEIIEIFTEDELRQILAAPDKRLYGGFRDYTLMHVLLDTFLRTNEALSLQEDDIDFEMRTITVRGKIAKGRRARILPISSRTANLLRELIKENEDFDSQYVFLANYGERLTSNNFRHRLKYYARKAGIKRRVYPYLFRHTGATMFLEHGGDIRHLQLLLGHTDMRMVKRYTHLSTESLKLQHAKHTPLNRVVGKLNRPRKVKRTRTR